MRKFILRGAIFCVSIIALAGQAARPEPLGLTNEVSFFQCLDLNRPDLVTVRKAVEAGNWTQAKAAWAAHLADRTNPRWVWSRRDRAAIEKIYDQRFGGLARYTNAADKVLARDFTFGGARRQLTTKVNWLQGVNEWTHVLSRFGYWEDLGRAYWGTSRSCYARDFVDLLQDWIQANPVPADVSKSWSKHGSVWRTLETGIRGQSWFDAMEFFMDAPEFDAEAKYQMSKSLVEHARYLAAWETQFRGGNWQVCEASGLATIGIMLPECKAAAEWRRRGLDLLVEHMQRDVEPDGMHWELTPGYHSWVMKEFLHVSLLCRVNGIEMPGLMDRHEKMYEVLLKLARPNRTYPPVGDAGTGSVEVGENLGVGALLYDRPDFRFLATGQGAEEWVWLLGPDVFQRYARLKSQVPAFTSVLLPDSQYAVMRTGWKPEDKYLLFDCAPWRGGHSHQDRLQVTVIAGRDLIADAGMCSYDEPISRELRRSAAHSVLVIDGQEQLQGNPKLLDWQSTAAADFASGEVAADDFTHRRCVFFVKPNYWVVLDTVQGQGNHEVTRLFHFPPGPAEVLNNGAQTDFSTGTNIRVQPVDDGRMELRSGLTAVGPVTVETSPVAAIVAKGNLPLTLCTLLVPFEDQAGLPKVDTHKENSSGSVTFTVTFPNGQRDEIAIAGSVNELRVGDHRAKAKVLCVRQGPETNTVITIP